MTGFSNFIVQEELRSDHAERFLLYVDRYHLQVFSDLREDLLKAWKRDVSQLSKSLPPASAVQDAQLKNPKATVSLTLDEAPVKLVSSRTRSHLEVSPSVRVPLVYPHEKRDQMIDKLLSTAQDCLTALTHRWSEIFKVEKKGRAEPWFQISRDRDDVRLQLVVSVGDQEVYKTLYTIRVEFGKVASKLRDFDRVYLTSQI